MSKASRLTAFFGYAASALLAGRGYSNFSSYNPTDYNITYWFQDAFASRHTGYESSIWDLAEQMPRVFDHTAFDPTQILNSGFTAFFYSAVAAAATYALHRTMRKVEPQPQSSLPSLGMYSGKARHNPHAWFGPR